MRLIATSYDPASGFTEEMWYEEPLIFGGPGRVTIRRLQDVDEILDSNKEQFNQHNTSDYSDSNGFHKVAEIPLGLVEKWMKEGFNWYDSTHKQRAAKLNDRDYQKLLVRPGRI